MAGIVKIIGDVSGYVQLTANSTGNNNTLILPNQGSTLIAANSTLGSNGQLLVSNGTVAYWSNANNVVTNAGASVIVSGNSVATTSGTSIDITGIPSWAKRISIILSGVSINASGILLVQLGSGSIANTGYSSGGWQASATYATATNGMLVGGGQLAASVQHGIYTLALLTGSTWVGSGSVTDSSGNAYHGVGGGTVAGSATLGAAARGDAECGDRGDADNGDRTAQRGHGAPRCLLARLVLRRHCALIGGR
jgi:hypothetical protein